MAKRTQLQNRLTLEVGNANAVNQREHDVSAMDAVLRGPSNEQFAVRVAEFVDHHPVPVVAQCEIAHARTRLAASTDWTSYSKVTP